MAELDNLPSISVLPEGCVTDILSITSPRDACRAALISKAFHSVADSDVVWERFLPSDYREIIGKAVSPVGFESKKELYHRLSVSYIVLDRGNLGFKLDKESGRKCYMIGARDLSIAFGNDTRYWEWSHVPESRFAEVGILKHRWWLDIQGKIASVMLSQKTTYVAYLVFRISKNSWGLLAAGNTIVSVGGVRNGASNVYLQQPTAHVHENIIVSFGEVRNEASSVYVQPLKAHAQANMRNDGWMELVLGEFYCDNGDDGEVEMVFQEHHRNKGGLIVEGIELRPK
ncbi:putative F-box protein PP2-B12 [Bidens hawaiensis]|uniref:putative F-box protein PP2-B12 n=1 Tax=Bidens hawaiensis TaxID=980011 RepID=UPI00404983C8